MGLTDKRHVFQIGIEVTYHTRSIYSFKLCNLAKNFDFEIALVLSSHIVFSKHLINKMSEFEKQIKAIIMRVFEAITLT